MGTTAEAFAPDSAKVKYTAMKPFTRSDRVGGLIQQVMAELLQKQVSDPRLTDVTITGVQVSRDLRLAKIYFCMPAGEVARSDALDGFARARGFLKRELAQRLTLRYMPDLRFYYDGSFDYGAHIERLLKTVKDHDPDN
jgi:ribosome-binding factor A